MPITRRPSAAHERLAALAAGPSGWVPAAPDEAASPGEVWVAAGAAPESGRGRHRAAAASAGPAAALVPSTVRGGRWRVSRRAAAGALLALAVLAAALALRAGTPDAGTTLVPARTTVQTTPASTAASTAAARSSTPAAPTAGPAGAELVVHVVGQVRAPGLVRVAAGSRVADVLTAAGGATAEADLSRVNLARPVVDGEQLLVPLPGEGLAAPAPGASAPGGAGSGPVNLNDADLATLDGLTGIGPILAQRILDWRQTNGRFSSVDELGEVSGIGDKLLTQLRAQVTV